MARLGVGQEPQHRYVAVLVLTMASFTFALAAPLGSDLARLISVTLQGATLIAAVATSGASRHLLRLSALIVGVAVLASFVAMFASDDPMGTVRLVQGALAIVAPVVVARGLGRVLREDGVTLQVVFGALAIYLLIGMSFAFVDGAVAALDSGHFFAQPRAGDGETDDHIYFSFVTLTTTGYGDLTASPGLPRALAILEAIFGQLYLVTVVALVVSNLGRARRPRDA